MTTATDRSTDQQTHTGDEGGASRRTRDAHPRSKRVLVKLNEKEYDDLAAAAERAELTTTGFVATAALAAARSRPSPTEPAAGITRTELAALQRDLFAARAALGKIGSNLNQAVKLLHTNGRPPTWLDDTVARCHTAMRNLDTLVAEVDRRLR